MVDTPTNRPSDRSAIAGAPRFAWVNVLDQIRFMRSLETVTRAQADEWGLVLLARRIPHSVDVARYPVEEDENLTPEEAEMMRKTRHAMRHWPSMFIPSFKRGATEALGPATRTEIQLLVPPRQAQQAVQEILQYETENLPHVSVPVRPAAYDNLYAVVWPLAIISVFFGVSMGYVGLFGLDQIDWVEHGSARSVYIVHGEWWRAITALTLHADGAHLLGNLALGGVFAATLCREIGAGPGWLLILLSGVLGNVVNANVQGWAHNSVGASTAVFGAVGIVAGLRILQGQGPVVRKAFIPVAAGLTFLAFLGAGGENTDLGAHLFGFGVGMALGAGLGVYLNRFGLFSTLANRVMGAVAAALPVVGWMVAVQF